MFTRSAGIWQAWPELLGGRKAIPALKQIGVVDEAVRTMTVEVPRQFFEAAVTPG